MRSAYTWLLVTAVSGLALTTLPRGQEGRASTPTIHPGDGRSLDAVTVERHGPLLVLTYGPRPAAGALRADPAPRGEPALFAIYRGHRKVAAGQFEYG